MRVVADFCRPRVPILAATETTANIITARAKQNMNVLRLETVFQVIPVSLACETKMGPSAMILGTVGREWAQNWKSV